MPTHTGPNIVEDGLVLCLDAADNNSYPGSGNTWYDLSENGNNGTLINGVGYDSSNGGALSFDGVNDYSRPDISHSYLLPSALEVIFNSSSHSGRKTIFGYRHNVGYSRPTIGSIYLNNNTLSASVITTSQVYRIATFSTSILTNKVYHVVLNKDTINGTLQLFVNGQPGSIQTFDASTYAQWTTVGSFIGFNRLDIGKSTNTNSGQGWGNDYFNGKIYKLGVYSRILTPQEIQQNYNATKSRFGL